MKAKDLMIGDWVKWEYVTYPDVVVNNGYKKVDAIYGDESVDLIDEDTLYEHVPMYDVKVVELTAEILEKNSIQKVDNHTYVIGHNDERQDLYFSFSHDYNEIIVITYYDDEYGYHEISFGKICYVHEFQHLLHLYGIEKEVVI